MKKNLLIVIENLAIGGGQNMVYELAKNIDKNIYSVSVLCTGKKRNSFIETKLEKVCKVVYMNIAGHINPVDMWKVLRKISSFKPDALHAHLGGITFALPWARLHKKPVVITAHAKPEMAFSKRNEKLLRNCFKQGFVKLVAVSKENHKACKRYFGINDDKCVWVNNGIDVDIFYREKHEGFVFINLARQDVNKNQALLVKCFARLHREYPCTRLILAGDGPCHKSLVELVDSLGISEFVEFPGMVSNSEKYYARSDVYAQSSYREAMPLSVLEAMAAGLPIISTDIGGLRDVVKSNGILVEIENEEAYYLAMKHMCESNSQVLNTYSSESLELVKAYSVDNMTWEYCKLYDSLIK